VIAARELIIEMQEMLWRGLTARNVGIRSRGNTTRNAIKPGLRVDFNRYLANQEFLGLKALALDNAYSDVSLVRESVSMKVFNKLGPYPNLSAWLSRMHARPAFQRSVEKGGAYRFAK
jgi:glutathione S-transferase